MKKKILIVLMVLVVVSAVIFFFYLDRERKGSSHLDLKNIPDTPINKICLKISQPGDLYNCLAVANQDESFCQKIDIPEERKFCQGMAKRDVSFCRKIQEPKIKKNCYYELGFLVNKFDYCDETEDPNDCYFAFIHRLHWESRVDEIKPEYCEKLNSNTPDELILKNCCQAFRKQDPSLCQGNRYCLSYFEQPLSFCDTKIKALGGKFRYKESCLMDRAMSGKDPSLCAEISEEELRNMCYGNCASHISPDVSLCEKITNEAERNMCYKEVAINLSKK